MLPSFAHQAALSQCCSQPYPVPDITSTHAQDMAWREQQRRLLSAHFGPREVESLAMNAVLTLDSEEGSVAGAPLLWVQQREMKVRTGATRSDIWVLTVKFARSKVRCVLCRACFLLVSLLQC